MELSYKNISATYQRKCAEKEAHGTKNPRCITLNVSNDLATLCVQGTDKSDTDTYHVELENCDGTAAYKFYITIIDVPGPLFIIADGGAEISGYCEYGHTSWSRLTLSTPHPYYKARQLIRHTEYQIRVKSGRPLK